MTSDPLAQLRDIHLPEPVSWWPPALGWWLTAALLVGLLLSAFLMWRRRRQRFGYRREALITLQAIDPAAPEAAQQIGQLLRRTAKTGFPSQHWEALPTPLMLRQLNTGAPTAIFSEELIGQLERFLYSCDGLPPAIVGDFAEAARQWLDQHRPALLTCTESERP